MNIKLNDPISFNSSVAVITEKRILGIDVFVLVIKHNNGTYNTRSFNEYRFAVRALQEIIHNATAPTYETTRAKYLRTSQSIIKYS